MAARSRYAEDQLAHAVANSAKQYVVLGAGLDTFACRNPHPGVRVFEVDHPATQTWKRDQLQAADIAIPPTLTFVPLDFEQRTLADGLREAGFRESEAAFFSWLGVTPYLTHAAFTATLSFIARMPAGSGVVFDFAIDPQVAQSRANDGRSRHSPGALPPPANLSSSSSIPENCRAN